MRSGAVRSSRVSSGIPMVIRAGQDPAVSTGSPRAVAGMHIGRRVTKSTLTGRVVRGYE
jgi:hypothetical protein